MSNYNRLLNNLEELKLEKIRSYLPEYLDSISKSDVTLVDSLLELTSKELVFKNHRARIANIQVAAFPFKKEVSDFDFDFQPTVNKNQILDLATSRFLEDNKNILFVGPSGVGKTHLATAIGIAAAEKRYSTYFISCHDLISKLNKAQFENKLDQMIRHYSKYKLLIIDEIGYLPVDKQGANLFFQLIAKRYEKKSTIVTTNQPFSKWAEIFSDSTIANAILDRLLHHSYVIKIGGKSYRVKDKLSSDNEIKLKLTL